MSLSKHQSELPELCLLAIVSQMSLADRVSAHRVCLEWYQRVREANRPVNRKDNSITIATDGLNKTTYFYIKHDLQTATETAVCQMKRESKQFWESNLTVKHLFTKWNCLRFSADYQMNSATFQQIMSCFPEITELNFVGSFGLEYLVEILQAEPWKSQLTKLRVVCTISNKIFKGRSAFEQALFTAINNLPALQYLHLHEIPIYELPILAQLKGISIEGISQLSPKCLTIFLHSLREYATGNVDNLRVELHVGWETIFLILQELSEPLLGCFTCLSNNFFAVFRETSTFPSNRLTAFSGLTLLYLHVSNYPEQFPALFRNLAQLPQLAYLNLVIKADFWNVDTPEQLPPRPRHQLLSVRTLKLSMYISTHFILRWFNLFVTMPNVQDIDFQIQGCTQCDYNRQTPNTKSALQCLRTNFRELMANGGFTTQQITCYNQDKSVSTHKLLFSDK